MKLCKCGCGNEVTRESNVYINHHCRTGIKLSKKTKLKMSEAQKGHTISDETKLKMSQSHKGKKLSVVHKRNIGKALKRDINNIGIEAIHLRARKYRKNKCEICGMTNDEHKLKHKSNLCLSMHCRDHENYRDLSEENWLTLCEFGCHQKMEKIDRIN